ncbi:fluoride efflux transporter CrcB [Bacillus sp. 1NLA3E]|uniref:fluoride efflux transporter CrcB n=1 Tax=Bacillus sp. 1NLA3E TaxID=666686 RepID=UPI000247F1E3|nr:fluoride efflux transporter CrcB [Bacillus sp. 1NLA3E]AGK52796.1 CrcB protein [Bacillus sp. 1NLA3E]
MMWLIGIGGSIGAGARFILGNTINKKTNTLFPIATWIINILGSFLLGLLVNLHNAGVLGNSGYYIFGIGFCGAFTTFSTFTNEVVLLFIERRAGLALFYIICSVLVAFIGAFLGLRI